MVIVLILMVIGAGAVVTYVQASSIRAAGASNLARFVRCRYLAEAGLEHAAYTVIAEGSEAFEKGVIGPFQVDDSGDSYEFWGQAGTVPGEYLVSARGKSADLISDASAVLYFSKEYVDDLLDLAPEVFWQLNETGGSTAEDRMENHDGQYKNGPKLGVEGALPDDTTAVQFDGKNDYVDGDNDLKISGDEITILAWVRGTATDKGEDYIVCQSPGGSASKVSWSLTTKGSSRNPAFRIRTGGKSKQIKASLSLKSGQWYFIVATYDGSKMKLYIDGALVKQSNRSGNLQSSKASVFVGRQPGKSGYWKGDIDHVAVFGNVLTADDIQSLYDSSLSGGGVEWRSWND
jgi:hypothetical protein